MFCINHLETSDQEEEVWNKNLAVPLVQHSNIDSSTVNISADMNWEWSDAAYITQHFSLQQAINIFHISR